MSKKNNDFQKFVKDFKVGDFDFVKHNPTDFDSFREFSKDLGDRYEEARKAKEKDSRRKNLLKWLEQVPDRWRAASFRSFDPEPLNGYKSSATAAENKLRNKQLGYFISGPHTSGKSYLAYAIIRKYVASGKLKPSQIRVITEGDLLMLANGGYESRDRFEKIFDSQIKCYLFDSLGTRKEYDDRREAPALTRLIEEAYNRSALFIATSHMDLDLYESGLPEQAAAKLRHMVKDGIVYTGQPLYGKSDERNDLNLDVDLYNLEGELSFSTPPKTTLKSKSKTQTKKSSVSTMGSWKESMKPIKD